MSHTRRAVQVCEGSCSCTHKVGCKLVAQTIVPFEITPNPRTTTTNNAAASMMRCAGFCVRSQHIKHKHTDIQHTGAQVSNYTYCRLCSSGSYVYYSSGGGGSSGDILVRCLHTHTLTHTLTHLTHTTTCNPHSHDHVQQFNTNTFAYPLSPASVTPPPVVSVSSARGPKPPRIASGATLMTHSCDLIS